MKEIAKHQKLTRREEGLVPAPPVTIHSSGVKERSGDESLFPTCDFLRLRMGV